MTDQKIETAWPTGEQDAIRARVLAHEKADEIIQGEGWNGRRGCAIGCALNNYDHLEYARRVTGNCLAGYQLARLVEKIHEGVAPRLSVTWPRRFTAALQPGVHPRRVLARWFIWLLTVECPSQAGTAAAELWSRVLAGDEPSQLDRELEAEAAEAAARVATARAATPWAATARAATALVESYARQAEALLQACREESP